MQLLIQWPYSLYDESYCAVIVRHDGDMAMLLEQAVYAVARHSDSGLSPLINDGPVPPHHYPAVISHTIFPCSLCGKPHKGTPDNTYTLDDFALYKDGVELPRTGSLAEAGIADRDWLMLDYAARDRFGKGTPASQVEFDDSTGSISGIAFHAIGETPPGGGPREYPFPFDGGPSVPHVRLTFDGSTHPLAINEEWAMAHGMSPVEEEGVPFTLDALRTIIREEIAAHERKQMDRARRARHPGENA